MSTTDITTANDQMAQTGMITGTLMLVALTAIVAFVALGVYRARHSAARETQYRELAEQAGTAQAQIAESSRATTAELAGLRSELAATHTELTQVRQRLTEVERLLSQVG
ncbi:hypothetical protein ACIBJE_21605 [Micromonospora sp. NPDC050187]|uniref:hypothetical protein n=1 Tax=Micromonospora sp. NPDC050187 TaxID=3364277 RepID=UPI0037B9BA49